jgi:protein tyrosine phosphatase
MVHEKADCIIMLMQSEEYGHLEYAKPVRYLECDESKMDYSVSRTYKSRSEFIEGSILEIKLKGSDQPPKKVPHFHYAMWVEGMKGNPDHIATLARNAMKAKKPVIHCWTGNGRAAVVAAVIASYENIIKGDRSPDVIKNAITALQKERPGAVSEPSQRRAVYEATKALLIEDRLLKK